MTTLSSTIVGKYVYAFVRAEDGPMIEAAGLEGLHGAGIGSSQVGAFAAISSPIEAKKIRPQRQLLAAHQKVVSHISRHWDMLPVSFGLIADSDAELETLLLGNAEELNEMFNRVSGMVEMNFVLSWATDDVYRYLVSKHSALQVARDLVASGNASHDDMVEAGRTFERVLAAEREEKTNVVIAGISSATQEIETQNPKSEKEIVRVNCLISRDGEPEFTEAIHRLAEQFNEDYAITFNGPWPPYSFVSLKLALE